LQLPCGRMAGSRLGGCRSRRLRFRSRVSRIVLCSESVAGANPLLHFEGRAARRSLALPGDLI
jgi:hypothetical protein